MLCQDLGDSDKAEVITSPRKHKHPGYDAHIPDNGISLLPQPWQWFMSKTAITGSSGPGTPLLQAIHPKKLSCDVTVKNHPAESFIIFVH